MRGILRSVGVDTDLIYVWSGVEQTRYMYALNGGGAAAVNNFRLVESAHPDGFVGSNPHFSFHALIRSAGRYFDPSYGQVSTSPPVFDESVNPGTRAVEAGYSGGRVERSVFKPYVEDTANQACQHTSRFGE